MALPLLGIVPRIHHLACYGRCGSCVGREGGGGDLCFGGEKGVVAVHVLEEDPDQLQGMARSKKPVTREETGNAVGLRGGRHGRRPQTTSYRKSKESTRVTDASDVDKVHDETSPVNVSATEQEVDGEDEGENEDQEEVDEEGEEEGEDQVEEEEQEDSKEVKVRSHGKARGKSKRSSRKMVQEAEYDISKPCPGGPSDQTILSSFNNHVAAAIPIGLLVTWDPYSDIRIDNDNAEIAFYIGTLKFLSIVESCQSDRFLRQMGYIQRIPLPPYKPTRVKRGKSAASYIAKYNFQPEMWERWQDHVLSARSRGNRATYACEAASEYIPWFLKISHPTIENPKYYVGGNFDGDDLLDRSLPPGEADMASAFKMADDVLMHLTGNIRHHYIRFESREAKDRVGGHGWGRAWYTLTVTSDASGVRPHGASGPVDPSLSRGRRKTVWGDTDGVGLGTTLPVTSDASGVRPHGASGPVDTVSGVFGVGYDWATDPSFTGVRDTDIDGGKKIFGDYICFLPTPKLLVRMSSEHQTRNEGKVVNATTSVLVEQQQQQSSPQHRYRHQGDRDRGQSDRSQGQGFYDKYTGRRKIRRCFRPEIGSMLLHCRSGRRLDRLLRMLLSLFAYLRGLSGNGLGLSVITGGFPEGCVMGNGPGDAYTSGNPDVPEYGLGLSRG
ncbi:hypothetical protein Sjap_013612 [Stephania japonica]|uniref:Uncharacterized protein n=1 Tax=Stephania japonica TaxID=461633 RepID=A0AAP0IZ13_9MAGN